MKLGITSRLTAMTAIIAVVALLPQAAFADFNKNLVIGDGVFDDHTKMTANDIQDFLDQFPNSCLKGYKSAYPEGYNSYGSKVSAASVIKRAAQIYNVNPQVILSTLQKESSVVTGNDGCASWRYQSAMGMGCPDGGGCPAPGYEGFSRQVTKGTWLLKFGKERSNGNVNWEANDGAGGDFNISYGGPMTEGCKKRNISSPVVCYDGFTTIDGQSVYITTGATGSFYNYTPHLHGNELFVSIFEGWFGPTANIKYKADVIDRDDHPMLKSNGRGVLPGEEFEITFRVKNIGNMDWFDEQGLDDAPFGTKKVILGTQDPPGRSSSFANNWTSCNCKPAYYFSRVYESDGSTLSGNQHKVEPGQIVEWDINFKAPNKTGLYRERIEPIVFQNQGLMKLPDGKGFFDIEVISPVYKARVLSRAGHPRETGSVLGPVTRGQVFVNTMRIKNIGNSAWYDQVGMSSAEYTTKKIILGTQGPSNRASSFANGWTSCKCKPASNFSRVYESDGATLSGDQHVVEPGQIAEWDISFKAPNKVGIYRERIEPIVFQNQGLMKLPDGKGFFDIEVVP